VERLGLSKKILRAVKAAGIGTLDDLRRRDLDDLAHTPGIGKTSVVAICSALEANRTLSVAEDDQRHIADIHRRIAGHETAIAELKFELQAIAMRARFPRQ
jgi:DNA-directed RNA polymerase alpha subunit